MLDLDIDPKLAWALRHPERFPVDLNTAPREDLLRVPGLGTRNVDRIVMARRHGRLRVADRLQRFARGFAIFPSRRQPPRVVPGHAQPRQQALVDRHRRAVFPEAAGVVARRRRLDGLLPGPSFNPL